MQPLLMVPVKEGKEVAAKEAKAAAEEAKAAPKDEAGEEAFLAKKMQSYGLNNKDDENRISIDG